MVRILLPDTDTSQAKLACDHGDLYLLGVIEKQANSVDPNMLAMLFNPIIAPLLEQYGYEMPVMGGSPNLYDQLRERAAQNDLMSAMQATAQLDAPTYAATARGLLDLAGRDVGGPSDEAVAGLASGMAEMSPYLSMMMPELWDRLHGRTGSAGSLASALMRNSRWTGMTPERAQAITGDIMGAYRTDPDQFSGLSTYELGDLYQEMRARGMIPTDTEDVSGALAGMTAPIAAVRDLGLPAGLATVAALTPEGTGVNWMDPKVLAHKIRTNANISRQGGYAPHSLPSYWGAMDRDKWNKLDQRQRRRAASSPAANRIGAAYRLAERMGFTIENPSQIGHMNDREWSRWIQAKSGGKVSNRQAYAALHSQAANQEYAFNAGAPDLVRNMQGQEAAYTIDRYLGGRKRQGIGDFIMSMDPSVASSTHLRNQALQNKYNISPVEAETLWTDIDETFRRRHNTSLADLHTLHSKPTVKHMKGIKGLAEQEAREQAKVTGQWSPDWLRRGAHALQQGKNPIPPALGFIPKATGT